MRAKTHLALILALGGVLSVCACSNHSRKHAPPAHDAGREPGDAAVRDATTPRDGAAPALDAAQHQDVDAADGGGHADAGHDAAANGDDAGSTPDASGPMPYVFTPDPVTMGQNLPSVIPVLRVDVGGQTIQKDVDIAGQLEVFETHDGTLGDLDTRTPTLTSKIAFQGRGNFTWYQLPKQGYAFELQDALGNELDQPLLGLPAGSDFALYACYTDKTCLRDALVFALGQQLGRWSPRTRFVELFIDGDYRGLYMVWERIRRSPTRVRIPKPAAVSTGDLTGGYIIRHEGIGKGAPRDFTTTSGIVYSFHYPDVAKLSADQQTYITTFFQSFEDALQSTPASCAAWLDVPSWVDHAIVEEVTNNWDGYVHSIYMVKHADTEGGLLGMDALWDYDLAFGNGNVGYMDENNVTVQGYSCKTDDWGYQIGRPAPDDVPFYWRSLYAEATFQHAWKCRYQQLRAGPLSLATIDAQIAAWKPFTAVARARDQAKWNTLAMSYPVPNCFLGLTTYDQEVDAMHNWIVQRLTWLDTQAAAMPGACP
ncbi:MAG TPA: CotH kinase family protein [Polyangiales bacterium]|nr:CotH kinase family protein [Polyangiales bacterium]